MHGWFLLGTLRLALMLACPLCAHFLAVDIPVGTQRQIFMVYAVQQAIEIPQLGGRCPVLCACCYSGPDALHLGRYEPERQLCCDCGLYFLLTLCSLLYSSGPRCSTSWLALTRRTATQRGLVALVVVAAVACLLLVCRCRCHTRCVPFDGRQARDARHHAVATLVVPASRAAPS